MQAGRPALSDDLRFSLALDFTPGPGLLGTQALLNTALRRLLEQVRNVKPHELGTYYLEVAVWAEPGSVVCHVPVTWDVAA
jgi:hypothetical protein